MPRKQILTALFASFFIVPLADVQAQSERGSTPAPKTHEQKKQGMSDLRKKMISMGKDIEREATEQNIKNERDLEIEYEKVTREEEKYEEENPEKFRVLP